MLKIRPWMVVLPALLVLISIPVLSRYPLRLLTVENEDQEILYMRAVDLGDRYAVRFTHSVARRPVDEI